MRKNELIKKIQEKEKQLSIAVSESDAWNTGKYKTSSNAKISKIFIDSLRKEIKCLHEELSNFSAR